MKLFGFQLHMTLPSKSTILILDKMSETALYPIISQYDFETVDTRGSDLNFWVLGRAFLQSDFWLGKRQLAYLIAYVKSVRPKIMISIIDNNRDFVQLCDRFSGIKSILIQNGWRETFEHLEGRNNWKIDDYLVFNSSVKKLVQESITGVAHAVGSLRNNSFAPQSDPPADKPLIIFVSQYEPPEPNFSYRAVDGTVWSWEEFYGAEIKAVKLLGDWCSKQKVSLQIKSRYSSPNPDETSFFEDILGQENLHITYSSTHSESYNLLDCGAMFVQIDSTLGYEALARGARVAFMCIRNDKLGQVNLEFGWPHPFPTTGAYWISTFDEQSALQLLDRVYVRDAPKNFGKEVMELDLNNQTLRSLISKYALDS